MREFKKVYKIMIAAVCVVNIGASKSEPAFVLLCTYDPPYARLGSKTTKQNYLFIDPERQTVSADDGEKFVSGLADEDDAKTIYFVDISPILIVFGSKLEGPLPEGRLTSKILEEVDIDRMSGKIGWFMNNSVLASGHCERSKEQPRI